MISTKHLGRMCAFLLCGLLVGGLWPFHAPRNEVTWLERYNGLRFGKHGTILGSGAFKTSLQDEACISLEVWSQPSLMNASNIFLTFYTPENPLQFSLRQYRADLILQSEFWHEQRQVKIKKVDIEGVFSKERPSFLTITSSTQGTAVYLDGVLVRTFPRLRLTSKDITGRLVFGSSPVAYDTWAGQLRGLAIYERELTGAQVLQHYKSWTEKGRPAVTENERSIALYVFDEHTGSVVHNQVNSGIDLQIPEQYTLLNPIFLGEVSLNGWRDILVNISGFIPVGFLFRAYFSARQIKRPALAAVILGGMVSLIIEILQTWLPTRGSDMTDVITDVLGTSLGVMLYRCKAAQALFERV